MKYEIMVHKQYTNEVVMLNFDCNKNTILKTFTFICEFHQDLSNMKYGTMFIRKYSAFMYLSACMCHKGL